MITVRLRMRVRVRARIKVRSRVRSRLRVSRLPRCHSKPSATAFSSHAIALRSSSDMNLPYLVSAGQGQG